MNYLLAKLKGRDEKVWKVSDEEQACYELPDLSQTHDFDPSYKLDENEWYKIQNFSTTDFTNELIGQTLNTTNYDQLEKKDFTNLLYLCCMQENYRIFQKITPSQILKKRWLSISDSPFIHRNEPIVVLSNSLDAIYDTKSDILFFKKLSRINQIFEGIESLYREATQNEVTNFLNQDFIAVSDDYKPESVGAQNRKRIALAMDQFNQLSDDKKKSLIAYSERHLQGKVLFENGKFNVSSEEQLKNVLYALGERFYDAEISGERRLANSVKKLEPIK